MGILLAGCSADSQVRGGASPMTSAPAESSIPITSPPPAPTEIAEGLLEPSDAPTLAPLDPAIPRASEAPEAVTFAQALAASLLYFEPLFTPSAATQGASLLQSPPGLSITRLVDWYEWVKNESTWTANRSNVAGYLFLPPEQDSRRYAVPAVQDIQYSPPTVTAGPPSSIDSRPTFDVTFRISGRLIWVDRAGTAWTAPLARDIQYVMASQNGEWVIDKWRKSIPQIGTPSRVPADEAQRYTFTPWESDTDIPYPFPVEQG